MKKDAKIILGIPYLHTTILIIFSAISYLVAVIFTGIENIDKHYLISTSLIGVIFIASWIILCVHNKKLGQSFAAAFKDNTSRKTCGTLLLLSCLISMAVLIPSQVYSISQIIKNDIDGSVVPNIVSFAVFICEFLIAIYFVIYKDKTGSGYDENIVIGMPFLYILLTSAFSLLLRLARPIIFNSSLKLNFYIWLISTLIVLGILFLLLRKKNQSVSFVVGNATVLKSTGILLIISSIFSISTIFNSVIGSLWLVQFLGALDRGSKLGLIVEFVRVIIFMSELILGFKMLKFKKSKETL